MCIRDREHRLSLNWARTSLKDSVQAPGVAGRFLCCTASAHPGFAKFYRPSFGQWLRSTPRGSLANPPAALYSRAYIALSLIHIRAHETPEHLVCRLLLEKK